MPVRSKSHEFISALSATPFPFIVNFNYTDTIHKVIDMEEVGNLRSYEIKNIINFHGDLRGDIILGIEDSSIPSEFTFFKKSTQKDYTNNTFRLGDELAKAEMITFWGYSLGISDHTYFSNYFQNILKKDNSLPIRKINICHYGIDGKNAFDANIDRLVNGKVNAFKEKILLKYYDVSDNQVFYEFTFNNSLQSI